LDDGAFVALVFGLIILAGVAVLWMAMQNRRLLREMEHRERLAMIERGLVPPPELDPGAFERRTGLASQPESQAGARSRSAGIIMIGFGLGLMVLISFAAETPSVGIGIGGAFALLGAAFVFNSMVMGRRDGYRHDSLTASRPYTRPLDSTPRAGESSDPSRNTTP
jgi:Flp pilus assembly protein TadB